MSKRGTNQKGGRGQQRNGPFGDKAAQIKINQMLREQAKKFSSAKDMLFVLSEISNYLSSNDPINNDFLDMIVQIMAIKNIHKVNQHNSDLLSYGARSITNLIPKVPEGQLSAALLDRILQLFLHILNPRIRQQLALGLQAAFAAGTSKSSHHGFLSEGCLAQLVNLNKLKRGLADLELDCDSAISAIQSMTEDPSQLLQSFDVHQLAAIAYSTSYYCRHDEYSVREYAIHFLAYLLNHAKSRFSLLELRNIFFQIEQQFVRVYLAGVKDELVLKSVLEGLRSLIVFAKETGVQSQYGLSELFPLCNPSDDNDDFFSGFLGIKLKQRQRCLKSLLTKLAGGQF